jgi:hypothetical protein
VRLYCITGSCKPFTFVCMQFVWFEDTKPLRMPVARLVFISGESLRVVEAHRDHVVDITGR